MKTFMATIAVAVLSGVLWGKLTDTRAVPLKPPDQEVAADSAWYRMLPGDPAAATEAYLQRVPADTRARGRAFSATTRLLVLVRTGVLLGSIALILFSGVAARMRGLAQRITSVVSLQDALVALQLLAALFLLILPVETYAGFVRIHRAGLSSIPYFQWLTEAVLGWAVITTFYVIGLVAILALIRRRPQSWVGWATALYGVLAAVYLLIAPQYIEPLFNRVTPLANGPRKEAILSLARANGVPAHEVFVRDASRQSVLINAHVSGFAGTTRIVLDDNTIARTPDPIVQVIMAHEIGHYVLAHGEKEVIFDTLVMGLGFLFIAWASRRLLGRFGRRWQAATLSDSGALPVFWGLFLLWSLLSLPATSSISRGQESEADLYGINASRQPLGLADFAIGIAGVVQLDPPALAEWVFYDHPSPRRRIYAAMRWRAEHLAER